MEQTPRPKTVGIKQTVRTNLSCVTVRLGTEEEQEAVKLKEFYGQRLGWLFADAVIDFWWLGDVGLATMENMHGLPHFGERWPSHPREILGSHNVSDVYFDDVYCTRLLGLAGIKSSQSRTQTRPRGDVHPSRGSCLCRAFLQLFGLTVRPQVCPEVACQVPRTMVCVC